MYKMAGVKIILMKEGKILLQHRDKKAPLYPNFWGLCGGKMDEGETPEEAIVR